MLAGMAAGASPWLSAAEAYGGAMPQGRHAAPTDLLSAKDARVLNSIAKYGGAVGDALQVGSAVRDWYATPDNPQRNEQLGGAAGNVAASIGGGALTVALLGSVTNPVTLAIAVGVVAYGSGEGGEFLGSKLGGLFDQPNSTAGG